MKKKIFSVLALCCMCVLIMSSCGRGEVLQRLERRNSGTTKKELTQEEKEAKKRALQFVLYEELGNASSESLSDLEGKEVMYDEEDILIDGMDVEKAEIGTQENSVTGEEEKVVNITFTEKGKTKFAQVTAGHIDECIAIISKGKLVCAPQVTSEITNGKCVIYFPSSDVRELQDVVDALN